MRNTIAGVVLGAFALLAAQLRSPVESGAATTHGYVRTPTNPCAGVPYESRIDVESQARGFVSDSLSSVIVTYRNDSLGLHQWPKDSVVATTDSTVCAHVDSLISVWLTSPAAHGVTRVPWWTINAVARANPGKYWVTPVMTVDGLYYNFIVDSVGGGVKFFRSGDI